MEQIKSRFSSFVGKAVPSGSKVQGSAFPTLTVTSTKDKFTLNQKALAIMGIATGNYVCLIDFNRGEAVTNDENARFYITKGFEKAHGVFEGAKIGKGGGFSYSGVYSAMMINDPSIDEATAADMVNKNLGIFRTSEKGNTNFIAKQKVEYKLERYSIPSEEEGVPAQTLFEVAPNVMQEVFVLTEREVVEHNPNDVDPDVEDND